MTSRCRLTAPPRAARLLALLAALAAFPAAAGGMFPAKVVVVVDGDTLVVRDGRARRHEIRIAGIDAPEMRQPYGVRSRGHLVDLLYGKQVTVAWYKRDRYDRVLGRVFVTAGAPCIGASCERATDAGLAQIAAGCAWHDREHLDEQAPELRLRYAGAERGARSQRAGLWAESAPMPPWRYRHLHPRRLAERLPAR